MLSPCSPMCLWKIDLIDFMKDHFKECVFPVGLEDLLELIKLCVCDAKFCFNGKFYKQKFGLAMGNCLSPVCSNLYMEFFERNLLTKILPNHVKWFRYVDDVLCLWHKSMNLQSFLYDLNNLVPSIKFSVEQQNCLPFLDVLIIRKEDDFLFNVYRKPTNICSYIHFYSNHSINVKIATFSGMFLRALRV